jgi:glycosyltransferase involved in cell wall biosynthesis
MLDSVHSQGVPGLEHIVMDGGSTDRTHAILADYADRISRIVSGADDGQYDAINKGFALSSGEVMGWLNSDDVYLPGMLRLVVSIFERFPQIDWLTTSKPCVISATGEIISLQSCAGFSRDGFRRGENLPGLGWPATVFIQQESTFWRRRLWDRAGGKLDLAYSLAGDFDLWARFFDHSELHALEVPIGCFRRHATQRSAKDFARYIAEARSILERIGGPPAEVDRSGKSFSFGGSGLPFFNRRRLTRDDASTHPVVAYDWDRQDWYVTRR